MSEQKRTRGARQRAGVKKPRERDRADEERTPPHGDALDPTWDQPQPGYPAPERPRDRAEERRRRTA